MKESKDPVGDPIHNLLSDTLTNEPLGPVWQWSRRCVDVFHFYWSQPIPTVILSLARLSQPLHLILLSLQLCEFRTVVGNINPPADVR